MYFAPGTEHGAVNDGDVPLRIVVMGYVVDKDEHYGQPVKLPIANEAEAKRQVVGNHPPSTLYQLLLGDTTSQRDLLATAHRVTSLFIMEFTRGGTNFPHHHLRDEEIYLVLDGKGEIVAGGGADGVEGRRPAKPGDAYYYRPKRHSRLLQRPCAERQDGTYSGRAFALPRSGVNSVSVDPNSGTNVSGQASFPSR